MCGATPECPTEGRAEITQSCEPSVNATQAAQVLLGAAEWASLHWKGRWVPDSVITTPGRALGGTRRVSVPR